MKNKKTHSAKIWSSVFLVIYSSLMLIMTIQNIKYIFEKASAGSRPRPTVLPILYYLLSGNERRTLNKSPSISISSFPF